MDLNSDDTLNSADSRAIEFEWLEEATIKRDDENNGVDGEKEDASIFLLNQLLDDDDDDEFSVFSDLDISMKSDAPLRTDDSLRISMLSDNNHNITNLDVSMDTLLESLKTTFGTLNMARFEEHGHTDKLIDGGMLAAKELKYKGGNVGPDSYVAICTNIDSIHEKRKTKQTYIDNKTKLRETLKELQSEAKQFENEQLMAEMMEEFNNANSIDLDRGEITTTTNSSSRTTVEEDAKTLNEFTKDLFMPISLSSDKTFHRIPLVFYDQAYNIANIVCGENMRT